MQTRPLLLLIPLAALAGCGNKGGAAAAPAGDTLVATVNGDPITADEFNSYLPRKRTVQAITERGPVEVQVAGSLGLQALRDLVNRKLILQVAKDEGVLPTQADLDKELDYQTKRNPNFVRTLTQAGLTLDQIKSDLLLDLARFRVVTKNITVTPAEVDKYIADNPKAFVTPAQVELYWILLRDAKNKASVDQDLRGGTPFQTVATRYSEEPNVRQTNGVYPVRNIAQLNDKLRPIVERTKAGTATDWLKDGPTNWVKFFVQSKTGETKIKVDDSLKEQVRRAIAEQRGQQARDLGETLSEKLRSSQVDVKIGYLSGPWKEAIEGLKNQRDAEAEQAARGAGAPKGN